MPCKTSLAIHFGRATSEDTFLEQYWQEMPDTDLDKMLDEWTREYQEESPQRLTPRDFVARKVSEFKEQHGKAMPVQAIIKAEGAYQCLNHETILRCPRCGNPMDYIVDRCAVSRLDPCVCVCSPCGTEEALEALRNAKKPNSSAQAAGFEAWALVRAIRNGESVDLWHKNYGPDPFNPQMPLEALDLSVRAYGVLAFSKHKTLGDVVKTASEGRLLDLKNCGQRVAEEIIDKLKVTTGDDYSSVNGL